MTNLVSLERHGRIGVLRIANPPVNALSDAVLAGMREAYAEFSADPSFEALLLHCDGRTFIAGADITLFDNPDFTTAPFNTMLNGIEQSDRIVVAALHGTALGGGLEVALACHYRVAVPGTRVGLPEVLLGVLPGSIGTQRLPRLTGAPFALEMIQSGRLVDAQAACNAGIIDEISAGDPLQVGLAYTNALLDRQAKPRRVCDMTVDTGDLPADFFSKALQDATIKKPAYPAMRAIVLAVEAAVTLPFAEGAALEAELFLQCMHSPQSHALRHLFFAERQAAKIPGLSKDGLRTIAKVGVIGAGTMGSGIAMNFINAGLHTVIVETSDEALQRGLGFVRKQYEASVAKGRLSGEQLAIRMSHLQGTLEYAALADCDLVIEAVFENMDLKKQICARLGAVCKAGAIIATNTSTLDVDVLAEASGRPQDVLGLHFFSPANVMRLLEVVRGAKTAPAVLATVMKLATTIKKVAVVSGVCYGFIGNRMLEPYLRETEFLLLEGASPGQIDAAVESWNLLGMAMGPCRMLDMAGIDVGAKVVIEQDKAGQLPADPSYRAVVRRMFELGRLGQKSGAGYYNYEGRKPVPDTEVMRICATLAAELGIARRDNISNEEIIERLLYPLINEGAKILEQGIAYRASDIDIVWTAGYGFPDHRGGPMCMADQIGLPQIVARMAHYADARPDSLSYWTQSTLLSDLARQGKRLSEYVRP